MRWPLRYQILIPFTLVLLGAILAVSVFSAVLATQRARRQIEEQLQGIAGTLTDSTFPLTDTVLKQMHGLSGAEFVFTDLHGKVLAASNDLHLPPEIAPPAIENWKQLHLGTPVQIGNQYFFPMVLAMQGRGSQGPGRLHLLYPERNWQEERSDAALPPLVVGAVGLLVTAMLALLIASRLTHPILELRSQVSRIAKADYSPMPLPARSDEIRDLAADINRMAEQLAEMERAIRRGERMALLGQLAGGLAHHLRNNITGALMAVQLHARECTADPESLDVALRQLALTEENLKQFLAAPQSVAGSELAMHFADCRLSEVVNEVVELLDPSLKHRRVRLSVVDTCDGNDRLNADRAQLRQMLMNLVLNAADAAGPGGWVRIESELTLGNSVSNSTNGKRSMKLNRNPLPLGEGEGLDAAANSDTNSEIVLRILDSEAGPPQETIARLFEPFATSKPEGIGLGLTVARQIAQSHGGAIAFRRANSETCFEVRLPASGTKQPVAKPAVEAIETFI